MEVAVARGPAFLEVRIGKWFEARAGGWGAAALVIVVIAILCAAAFGVSAR